MLKRKTQLGWFGVNGCNLDQRKLVNIRPTNGGTAVVTGKPKAITYLEPNDSFIGYDKRNDKEFFFITRAGNLMLLGYATQTAEFSFIEKSFGPIGSINGFSVAGDFIVISTDNGMVFLHFYNDNYEYLGGQIELPVLSFGTTFSTEIAVKLQSMTLSDVYTSWAGDLLPNDKEVMTRIMKSAFAELKRIAKTESKYIHPIMVKVALRLNDGSLLWCPENHFVGEGYAQVNAVTKAQFIPNGVSAIASTSLKVRSWKPSVSVLHPGIGVWKNIVKSIEIYATEEQDTLKTPIFRCETDQNDNRLNSLRLMSDTSCISNEWKALPEIKKFRLMAIISDINAFLNGEMVPLEKATGIVPSISKNTSYLLDGVTYGKHLTPQISACPFSAEVLTTIANKCFAGNIGYILPQPPNYQAICSLSEVCNETASVNIAVDVLTSSGKRTVASSSLLNAWSPLLLPLITYPDSRAVRITVQVTAAGKNYHFSANMQPSASGEYAYAASKNLEKFKLEETPTVTPISSSNLMEWKAANLLVSENGNPLIWKNCKKAHNKGIIAIAPAFGYGSSWLLGRHSAYLFAIDGIYLLSFDKNGCSGATLVSQRQAKSNKTVAATNKGIVFADRRNNLCTLSGNKETNIDINAADISTVGYSLNYDEILLQTANGIAAISNGGLYCKKFGEMALSSTGGNSFFIDRNFIYSVEKEIETVTAIEANSGCFSIPEGYTINYVDWNIMCNNANISMTVYGDNGRRCHGEKISTIKANGYIGFPIRHRLLFAIKRTARLEVKGSLPSGTPLIPSIIDIK